MQPKKENGIILDDDMLTWLIDQIDAMVKRYPEHGTYFFTSVKSQFEKKGYVTYKQFSCLETIWEDICRKEGIECRLQNREDEGEY